MQVSIWEKETFYAPQDIVIVGSGFVGLWSAFYLKKKDPDLKITILDRGMIPTGASTRNAGFACFGSLNNYIDCFGQHFFSDDHFNLNLWKQVDRIFAATINFRMPLLAATTFDLDEGHALDANFGKRFFDFFELEGLDDCFNFFQGHGGTFNGTLLVLTHVARVSSVSSEKIKQQTKNPGEFPLRGLKSNLSIRS